MVFYRTRQAGIGIVTAIVLLVMLAGLAAAIVTLNTGQHVASGMDFQGSRAYQAARAGAEWAVYQARINDSCVSSSDFTLPAPMADFRVSVTCVPGTLDGIVRYHVRSTACTISTTSCPNFSTSADYVQRVVEVRFGE
jgi:MSHA biogenesis protein MshP